MGEEDFPIDTNNIKYSKMLVNFTGSKKQFIAKGYETTYANKVVFILGDVNSSNEEDKATCIFAQGKYFGEYDSSLAPEEYVTETELSQKGFLVGEETSEELDDIETNTYVKYVAQTLTDEQKNQVRENLGIPSVDYIISLFEELKTLINNNSASDAIAVLDKAILDMHKLQ